MPPAERIALDVHQLAVSRQRAGGVGLLGGSHQFVAGETQPRAAERIGKRHELGLEMLAHEIDRALQVEPERFRPAAKVLVRVGVATDVDQSAALHFAALPQRQRTIRLGRSNVLVGQPPGIEGKWGLVAEEGSADEDRAGHAQLAQDRPGMLEQAAESVVERQHQASRRRRRAAGSQLEHVGQRPEREAGLEQCLDLFAEPIRRHVAQRGRQPGDAWRDPVIGENPQCGSGPGAASRVEHCRSSPGQANADVLQHHAGRRGQTLDVGRQDGLCGKTVAICGDHHRTNSLFDCPGLG